MTIYLFGSSTKGFYSYSCFLCTPLTGGKGSIGWTLRRFLRGTGIGI